MSVCVDTEFGTASRGSGDGSRVKDEELRSVGAFQATFVEDKLW